MYKQREHAEKIFEEGYNCAQAVAGAFEAETGIDKGLIMKMSAGFGGGVSHLREVCGAVSGMILVMGLVYGKEEAVLSEEKNKQNERFAELALSFKKEFGCLRCGELLEKNTEDIPQRQYCTRFVSKAAEIVAKEMPGA